MTKVIQARFASGSFKLVPFSSIKSIVDSVSFYPKSRRVRAFAQSLAAFMVCNGFVELVEITYNSEFQKRKVIMSRAA